MLKRTIDNNYKSANLIYLLANVLSFCITYLKNIFLIIVHKLLLVITFLT